MSLKFDDLRWGMPMQFFHDYGDERNKGWCVFCGGPDETRDHVPSRVLLDEPYPENLPVLPSCRSCNNSFSLDEEYLACLVECARVGSVEQAGATRLKVGRALAHNPSLAARLAAARTQNDSGILWTPEAERVQNVILKLARGHVAYEQNEPQLEEPSSLSIFPLCALSDEAREDFETFPDTGLWPEVGSRAMHRLVEGAEGDYPWVEVQPGRYRYLVASPFIVRIVIADYLAAEIAWD